MSWNCHSEFERPAGRAAYSLVTDPELAPAVVLFVEAVRKHRGATAGEHIPDPVSFCYVAD
jgi:hypothetical protein